MKKRTEGNAPMTMLSARIPTDLYSQLDDLHAARRAAAVRAGKPKPLLQDTVAEVIAAYFSRQNGGKKRGA